MKLENDEIQEHLFMNIVRKLKKMSFRLLQIYQQPIPYVFIYI